jgi:hypothetical protein
MRTAVVSCTAGTRTVSFMATAMDGPGASASDTKSSSPGCVANESCGYFCGCL